MNISELKFHLLSGRRDIIIGSVNDYYTFCAKQQAEDDVFVDWQPFPELFSKITPE